MSFTILEGRSKTEEVLSGICGLFNGLSGGFMLPKDEAGVGVFVIGGGCGRFLFFGVGAGEDSIFVVVTDVELAEGIADSVRGIGSDLTDD